MFLNIRTSLLSSERRLQWCEKNILETYSWIWPQFRVWTKSMFWLVGRLKHRRQGWMFPQMALKKAAPQPGRWVSRKGRRWKVIFKKAQDGRGDADNEWPSSYCQQNFGFFSSTRPGSISVGSASEEPAGVKSFTGCSLWRRDRRRKSCWYGRNWVCCWRTAGTNRRDRWKQWLVVSCLNCFAVLALLILQQYEMKLSGMNVCSTEYCIAQ